MNIFSYLSRTLGSHRRIHVGGVMNFVSRSAGSKQQSSVINRLFYEEQLWLQGHPLIAGVDEVGRGCLLGPVVAAAVILPVGLSLPEIKDSKLLTADLRESLYDEILSNAVAVSTSAQPVEVIEKINIKQASRLAMKEAVRTLFDRCKLSNEREPVLPDWLLVDAESIDLPIPQTSIIKGDNLSQSIAAASIVAKVTRDRMAAEWETSYPGYGLIRNKGYATKEHWQGLDALGPTPLHRPTFLRKWSTRQLQLFEEELSAGSFNSGESIEGGDL